MAIHDGHEGTGSMRQTRKLINGKELEEAYGKSGWTEDQHKREEREHNTMCWVRPAAGIPRDTEGDRPISRELDAAGMKNSEGCTPVLAGRYNIAHFGCSTLPKADN
jgi:hypothetical protein